ncbi:MAG: HDIG domain-containing metalloprotein [Lutisporaceae bacterium]
MCNKITIELPPQVIYIIEQLQQKGFEAFVVGGCVRDSIIGRSPQDWDITTNSKPEDVKATFNKTFDTGLVHGTVTVLVDSTAYEVTTYRTEGKYINNRKPEKVDFINSIDVDLSRRDFTINAMAYSPTQGLVDPFKGLLSIEHKMIKAVGNAEDRFEEDALRMLRAVRFSAQLGYDIEPLTLQAIKNHSILIKNISAERIREELNKTLMADPLAFELLHATGLLKQIMPELDCCFGIEQHNPYHMYNVALHSLHSASNIAHDLNLRWTMLLHDIGKAATISVDNEGINHFYDHGSVSVQKAESIMQRLRFDNSSINKIKLLILHHDRQLGESDKSVRKAIAEIGADLFEAWLQVKEADISAQSSEKAAERLSMLDRVNAIYEKIMADKQCLTIKELAVNGDDLLGIGFKQDKILGTVLKTLFDKVLEQPELNNRATLLELSKRYL